MTALIPAPGRPSATGAAPLAVPLALPAAGPAGPRGSAERGGAPGRHGDGPSRERIIPWDRRESA